TMLYLERVRQAAAGAVDRTAPLAARAVKNPKVRKYLYWATLPLEERYRGVSCAFVDEEKSILRGERGGIVPPRKISAKLVDRLGKWLLRHAANERLPPECTAPGKRGFTVPVSGWFRKQLHEPLREALLAKDAFCRQRFGEKPLHRLLEDHKHGVSDRKEELYALWVLELWLRQHQVGWSARAPERRAP